MTAQNSGSVSDQQRQHFKLQVLGLPVGRRPDRRLVAGMGHRFWLGALGSVECSPDKPILLIGSSHEKRTAVKPRDSRDRELSFYVNKLRVPNLKLQKFPCSRRNFSAGYSAMDHMGTIIDVSPCGRL